MLKRRRARAHPALTTGGAVSIALARSEPVWILFFIIISLCWLDT
jgi:hypothetical protein